MLLCSVQLGTDLGLSIRSDMELINRILEGFPLGIGERLVRLGLRRADVRAYVLPGRALRPRHDPQRKRGCPRHSRAESERILRAAGMVLFAARVFGGPEQASAWCRTPAPELEYRVPLSLCRFAIGTEIVEEQLRRMQDESASQPCKEPGRRGSQPDTGENL